MAIWCHDNFIRYIEKAQFANWAIKRLARRKPKWIKDQNIWRECSRHRNNQTEALGSKKNEKAQQVHEGKQERSETTNNRSKWSNLTKCCRSALIFSFQKIFVNYPYCVLYLTSMQRALHFLPSPLLWLTLAALWVISSKNLFFLHNTFCLVCPLQNTMRLLHLLRPLFPGGRQQSETGRGCFHSSQVSWTIGKCFLLTLAAQLKGIRSQSSDSHLMLLCLSLFSCLNELMVLPISCQSAAHREKEAYLNGCLQVCFVN